MKIATVMVAVVLISCTSRTVKPSGLQQLPEKTPDDIPRCYIEVTPLSSKFSCEARLDNFQIARSYTL